MSKLTELQERIGYRFRQEGMLRQALTHSSYANERHMKRFSDNERLEFLGDAVLEVVSSDFLYKNYPELSEGDLTKLRASIVCEPTLALCTRELSLGEYLMLSHGESQNGGRERNSILSDAMEAVIGAIYLDGGFAPRANLFIALFSRILNTKSSSMTARRSSRSLCRELMRSRCPMRSFRRRDPITTSGSLWLRGSAGVRSERERGTPRRRRSSRRRIRHCFC